MIEIDRFEEITQIHLSREFDDKPLPAPCGGKNACARLDDDRCATENLFRSIWKTGRNPALRDRVRNIRTGAA